MRENGSICPFGVLQKMGFGLLPAFLATAVSENAAAHRSTRIARIARISGLQYLTLTQLLQ